MLACYDLEAAPPTYDFLHFLLSAELHRMVSREETIDLHIVPGSQDGFKTGASEPAALTDRLAMLRRVVQPMARLLPSVANVSCHEARPELQAIAGMFGHGRNWYGVEILITAAKAGLFPLRAPAPISNDVTITLREAPYWPARNSNFNTWLAVAEWLRGQGIEPIIIRDTRHAGDDFYDFETDHDAPRDLHHRANLYAGARLNLFVNNGPAWLSVFMDAPTLIVKLTNEFAGQLVTRASMDRYRFPDPWPNPRQRILWGEDRPETIVPELEDLLEMERSDGNARCEPRANLQ